jgi:hypothetical protein
VAKIVLVVVQVEALALLVLADFRQSHRHDFDLMRCELLA